MRLCRLLSSLFVAVVSRARAADFASSPLSCLSRARARRSGNARDKLDDPEAAAKSVFDAAWMYFAVLAASFGVLFWDRAEQRRRPVGRRPGMPEYGAISHKDDDDL